MNKFNTTKKLNIAVLQQSPDMGGAEEYMLLLINEFIENGHKVLLTTNKGKFFNKGRSLSIDVLEIPIILDIIGNIKGFLKSLFYMPFALFFYVGLLLNFKKKNVDIILMSGFSEKMVVSFLSLFINIPVIWIEYGSLKTIFPRNLYFPKMLYKLLKNIPKKIIIPANNTKENLVKDANISLNKFALIPCGIKLVNRKNMEEFPVELKGKYIIGNISRLTKEKGQQYLIKSLPLIIEKIPSVVLLIIGDGPDKKYFKDLAINLGIEDKVIFTGYVDDVFKYYKYMDIFVFPTVWDLEGFGLVMVEAMSQKIPVIASNLGPVPEIIDNGKTGILVQPKNAEAIAETVIELANNKEKRKILGENGYKKAIGCYDIKNISRQFSNVFYEVLGYE